MHSPRHAGPPTGSNMDIDNIHDIDYQLSDIPASSGSFDFPPSLILRYEVNSERFGMRGRFRSYQVASLWAKRRLALPRLGYRNRPCYAAMHSLIRIFHGTSAGDTCTQDVFPPISHGADTPRSIYAASRNQRSFLKVDRCEN